nr:putative zinc metalloproteinase [Quercus suber]
MVCSPARAVDATALLSLTCPTEFGDQRRSWVCGWCGTSGAHADRPLQVHQKVLLVMGQCADIARPIDGTVTVTHHQDMFPQQSWPVNDSWFKALVYLNPGPNRLRFDFTSPKLSSHNGQMQVHSSWININFLPLISSPPLQLCILIAKDSAETYDAVPERIQREGNGLDTAIRKFRMAAYLWQAFTAEQMQRYGFGRRCYRYEEEWQPGTLSWTDMEQGTMRNEAKIHIIRLDKTVAEIRDLDLAQQYASAKRSGDLFGIATDAVRAYFAPRPGQKQYVSCLFLDTKWDKQVGTVRGHAALGGGDDQIKLAIFGSHSLQSYPAHIEEVVPAFSDCTRTDTNYVANDCNESGSNWEAANIGIGAHLHETGHLLGCPHQESGVMLRDYVRLNRTFTTREPYSTRTKQPGQRLVLPEDECAWHRLDALRFRFHPCFQLPTDQMPPTETSVQVWCVDNGSILVTAGSGIGWIELFPEGDDLCHHWLEYLDAKLSPIGAPKQIMLTEQKLRDELPQEKKKKKLRIEIFSCGGAKHEVNDFSQLLSEKSKLKLPDGRPGYRSSKLGHSQMQGTQSMEIVFGICEKRPKLMRHVKVYHGQSLDGIEFFYEDGHSDLLGKRGGKPGGSDFPLDIRKSETILGFYVRAGLWIDGIQILTSTGRRSEVFGNATGGSGDEKVEWETQHGDLMIDLERPGGVDGDGMGSGRASGRERVCVCIHGIFAWTGDWAVIAQAVWLAGLRDLLHASLHSRTSRAWEGGDMPPNLKLKAQSAAFRGLDLQFQGRGNTGFLDVFALRLSFLLPPLHPV